MDKIAFAQSKLAGLDCDHPSFCRFDLLTAERKMYNGHGDELWPIVYAMKETNTKNYCISCNSPIAVSGNHAYKIKYNPTSGPVISNNVAPLIRCFRDEDGWD